MKPLGVYSVILVDVSFHSGFSDVKPSRLDAMRDAALAYASVITQQGGLVALAGFYRRFIPVHGFTNDLEVVAEGLSRLKPLERGVNLGDALKEAIYLLLSTPPGYAMRVLVIAVGGFRLGPPPDPIAFFARSAGVVVDFLTVAASEPPAADVEWITKVVSETGGVWEHAVTREEAVAKARLIASRSVEAPGERVWRPGLGVYPPRLRYTRRLS